MFASYRNIDFYSILCKQFPYLQPENIIFLYIGSINHEIIKALLYTTENFFKATQFPRLIQKKTFNILVECIQNIEKHTLSFQKENVLYCQKGSMVISVFDDKIQIFSSNVINQEQKKQLLLKEQQIKGKSKTELRELYKQQLIQGTISEKGGAGLGFIDMARKTNNQLIFSFYSLNDDYELFTLNVTIKK